MVHEDLRGGVYGLATIACLAPWVGVFGNVLGIINSFQGIAGEKTAMMAAHFKLLSESLWPTALGILVGLIAFWSYHYLTGRLQSLDLEMESASSDLLNQLSRFPGRFRLSPTVDAPRFGEVPIAQVEREAKNARWLRSIACVAIVGALFLGGPHVAFLLGISCLFAYPLWVKFLHRERGGLVLLGSLVCLCWSGLELLLGQSLP